MTIYISPPDSVRRYGRRIYADDYDYQEAKKQLKNDEHLYALCVGSGKSSTFAACVDEEGEFDRALMHYTQLGFIKFELYAVDERTHAEAQPAR